MPIKSPFAELGLFVAFAVKRINGYQQGIDGGGHGRVGHDVGQGGGDHKAAQIDHAGFFTHDDQHFIGQALGQAGFGEHQPDHDRCKNEHHRGHHEIRKGIPGRTNQEHGLQYADGQTGDADGHHLENPPGGGQQKYGNGPFAFAGHSNACPGDPRHRARAATSKPRKKTMPNKRNPCFFPVDVTFACVSADESLMH
jgi:hypothetical protein